MLLCILGTHMLIIDGSIGSDVSVFLARLKEETTLACPIYLYEAWHAEHSLCHSHDHEYPQGIIYLRVSPEIAYTRIQKRALPSEVSITLDHIKETYSTQEQFFIENKNSPKALQHLPVLVLNGIIDFQTDFAQYYNHLFYIKRFIKQIQDKQDLALGIYKEKTNHRHCC
jgi:deoxyadenosine/deoxycytidine kinase